MAQLTVRNLDEDTKARLKRRAVRHGQSMEEEVRQILLNAVRNEPTDAVRLGSRMAARFADTGFDGELPELRGQSARPLEFGE